MLGTLTISVEVLIAVGTPVVILLFSIGVATASVRWQLKRHEEKLDLLLAKQDTTNGTLVSHTKELLLQDFRNKGFMVRLIDLEK